MSSAKRERGAALLEMAMGLPAVVLLFIGLSDFSLLFWRQAQLEAFARSAISTVERNSAAYRRANEPALQQLSEAVQTAATQDSELHGVTVRLTRQYACPAADGGDGPLQDRESACAGQHIFLRVDCTMPTVPLLRPLAGMGFPSQAISRTYLRVL